eukprot:TRINITY_DN15758_c0_g1_i1.p1 TRINITY_DN15758_c0_g1~~TRINITY_DN15758_c0_g1_i1.p1  ORF type:complete len:130 (-),score=4.59 TRINITY_DN15758_c0_g1_i1:377-721(-)
MNEVKTKVTSKTRLLDTEKGEIQQNLVRCVSGCAQLVTKTFVETHFCSAVGIVNGQRQFQIHITLLGIDVRVYQSKTLQSVQYLGNFYIDTGQFNFFVCKVCQQCLFDNLIDQV